MSNVWKEHEIDGVGDLNQPITQFHFNALCDTLRREFKTSIESMEEKQEKLAAEIKENIAAMIIKKVQGLQLIPGDASVRGRERYATYNLQGYPNHVAVRKSNASSNQGNGDPKACTTETKASILLGKCMKSEHIIKECQKYDTTFIPNTCNEDHPRCYFENDVLRDVKKMAGPINPKKFMDVDMQKTVEEKKDVEHEKNRDGKVIYFKISHYSANKQPESRTTLFEERENDEDIHVTQYLCTNDDYKDPFIINKANKIQQRYLNMEANKGATYILETTCMENTMESATNANEDSSNKNQICALLNARKEAISYKNPAAQQTKRQLIAWIISKYAYTINSIAQETTLIALMAAQSSKGGYTRLYGGCPRINGGFTTL